MPHLVLPVLLELAALMSLDTTTTKPVSIGAEAQSDWAEKNAAAAVLKPAEEADVSQADDAVNKLRKAFEKFKEDHKESAVVDHFVKTVEVPSNDLAVDPLENPFLRRVRRSVTFNRSKYPARSSGSSSSSSSLTASQKNGLRIRTAIQRRMVAANLAEKNRKHAALHVARRNKSANRNS